jgi:hypothetical protein
VDSLKLLREHGCLAPANYLQTREAILVNHAEVFARVAQDFFSGMRLEAKQDFEEGSGGRRTARDMKQVSAWRNHSGNLSHALAEGNIFQRATGDDKIERVVREGK